MAETSLRKFEMSTRSSNRLYKQGYPSRPACSPANNSERTACASARKNGPLKDTAKEPCQKCRDRKVRVLDLQIASSHQCTYLSLHDPCERCKTRGFDCLRDQDLQPTPVTASHPPQSQVRFSITTPRIYQDAVCLQNALDSFRSNAPGPDTFADPESLVRHVASGQVIQLLIQQYGQQIHSLCVRHAILSCLYRLKINQCHFGPEPALRHLTESYRRTRLEINKTENATDVLYAVIFMLLGAMLDDRYEEFYVHAQAFNASLEFNARLESTTNQFKQGETAFGAIWVAAFAILYCRRPKQLLMEPPERTWALEDQFLDSCLRLIGPLSKAAESKILVGWLRIHMYFWSLGKAAEDGVAKWHARPLRVECPVAELEEFARPGMKPGSNQLIGFANFMPSSHFGPCSVR